MFNPNEHLVANLSGNFLVERTCVITTIFKDIRHCCVLRDILEWNAKCECLETAKNDGIDLI